MNETGLIKSSTKHIIVRTYIHFNYLKFNHHFNKLILIIHLSPILPHSILHSAFVKLAIGPVVLSNSRQLSVLYLADVIVAVCVDTERGHPGGKGDLGGRVILPMPWRTSPFQVPS